MTLSECYRPSVRLFAAVIHGCAAGLHDEALVEIYRDRIIRGEEYYLTGRSGPSLPTSLACRTSSPEMESSRVCAHQRGPVLGHGTSGLPSGRPGPVAAGGRSMEEALRGFVEKRAHWKSDSITADNLSELYLALGELLQAETHARDAVDYADKAGDAYFRAVHRTQSLEGCRCALDDRARGARSKIARKGRRVRRLDLQ